MKATISGTQGARRHAALNPKLESMEKMVAKTCTLFVNGLLYLLFMCHSVYTIRSTKTVYNAYNVNEWILQTRRKK